MPRDIAIQSNFTSLGIGSYCVWKAVQDRETWKRTMEKAPLVGIPMTMMMCKEVLLLFFRQDG